MYGVDIKRGGDWEGIGAQRINLEMSNSGTGTIGSYFWFSIFLEFGDNKSQYG